MARSRRSHLIERIGIQLGRELSTRTILFHQAIADSLGIASTDHKCLGFIADADHPVTAGELVTLTGLTSGAITGVIDRLEAAGLAYRERDAQDRRRVVVKAAPTARARVAPLFEGIGRAALEMTSRYGDDELAAIERYLVDCLEMLTVETQRLRAQQSYDKQRSDQPSSSNSSSSGGPRRVDGRRASR
jgi:DNA-binding MarR family transcriptional regulator